jgi:hypothetical protein
MVLPSIVVKARERSIVVQKMSPLWRRFVEGIAIAAFALISTIAVARIGLEPADMSRGVGVIFAPWVDADTAFVRAVSAGGRFVRFGGPSFVVIVEPEAAGYAERIKDAGALLLVDPQVIAACLSWPPAEQAK